MLAESRPGLERPTTVFRPSTLSDGEYILAATASGVEVEACVFDAGTNASGFTRCIFWRGACANQPDPIDNLVLTEVVLCGATNGLSSHHASGKAYDCVFKNNVVGWLAHGGNVDQSVRVAAYGCTFRDNNIGACGTGSTFTVPFVCGQTPEPHTLDVCWIDNGFRSSATVNMRFLISWINPVGTSAAVTAKVIGNDLVDSGGYHIAVDQAQIIGLPPTITEFKGLFLHNELSGTGEQRQYSFRDWSEMGPPFDFVSDSSIIVLDSDIERGPNGEPLVHYNNPATNEAGEAYNNFLGVNFFALEGVNLP